MVQKIKSLSNKNKLLDSLWNNSQRRKKSLRSNIIKAGTEGSFYRYFKNVDEMHRELIERSLCLSRIC